MLNFHNQSFMEVDTKCSIFILYSTSLYPNKSNILTYTVFLFHRPTVRNLKKTLSLSVTLSCYKSVAHSRIYINFKLPIHRTTFEFHFYKKKFLVHIKKIKLLSLHYAV